MTAGPTEGSVVWIPLDLIHAWVKAWPREALDQARIDEFAELLRDGGPDALPPIEVVPLDDGTYLVADGVHRFYAWKKLDAS